MNATLKPDQIIYFGAANTPIVSCMYHEGYFIHNFCKRQECGLPMCAECVKIHAEEHSENGWPNEFDLFSNCLTEQYNKQLEYLNLWAVDVQETYNLQEEIAKNQEVQRKKIQDAKAQIYHALEEYFRQIEIQIVNETTHQTNELQREIRAQHRMDFYDWQQQESILKKLNSQKCMPHLIKMYHDKNQTPECIYERHHNDHLQFMQRIRHSLRQVIFQDRLPQIIPLIKQSLYVSAEVSENQTMTYTNQTDQQVQQQVTQQQQVQIIPQTAQSQIIQNSVNKYSARVVQPFSIMREQPLLQQVVLQPQPVVPLQPVSFYPQQYQEQVFQSLPPPTQYYGQQSSPPQIIRPQVLRSTEQPQVINANSQKLTMAQRYHDEMNKNLKNYE